MAPGILKPWLKAAASRVKKLTELPFSKTRSSLYVSESSMETSSSYIATNVGSNQNQSPQPSYTSETRSEVESGRLAKKPIPMFTTSFEDDTLESAVTSASSDDEGEEDVCWICLGTSSSSPSSCSPCSGGDIEATTNKQLGPVVSCCRCPKIKAHRQCLARWQLQKAGTRDETNCRFCDAELPGWMDGLDVAQDVQPTMCIFHNGKVHAIRPLPGPRGLEDFCTRVADIMQLASPDMVSLAFDCVDPFTGTRMTLKGSQTYSAALYCASVAATRRKKRPASSSSVVSGAAAGSPNPKAKDGTNRDGGGSSSSSRLPSR